MLSSLVVLRIFSVVLSHTSVLHNLNITWLQNNPDSRVRVRSQMAADGGKLKDLNLKIS